MNQRFHVLTRFSEDKVPFVGMDMETMLHVKVNSKRVAAWWKIVDEKLKSNIK